MENNTNFKDNTTLMTAILVFLALALLAASSSSVAAQPITVDGDGSDWDPSWFLASDSSDPVDYGSAGYNLTGIWQHYNATEDKLYFMCNVTGVAGDSDGNGNPNTPDPGYPQVGKDQYGVGSHETYLLMINTSAKGDPLNSLDVQLEFNNNSATATGPQAHLVPPSSVEAAINVTGPFTPVMEFTFVEFSVGNVTGWMVNPYRYSLYGYVGTLLTTPGNDWLDEIIYVTFPPVANFTFVAGDCNQTVWFDPSGSYDDPYGGIENYTWDFDDGTALEVKLNNASFSHIFPVSRGAYNVSLTVADDDGLTNTLVRNVMVNRVPDMDPVAASKTSVTEPGELVLFEGWYSDPDADLLTHRWFIDGVKIASGSSTTYNSSVSYFVDRSITATLTIEDPHNCTNTSSVTVTYLCPPVPVIKFTGTGCQEVKLNASESYDLDGFITDYEWDLDNDSIYGEPGDDATGVTCTFSPVLAGAHWIGLKVTDNSSLSNTTRKQITVTGNPNAVAEANGIAGSIQLPEDGGWVVFDGTNSTAYPGTEIVDASCTWNIPGMSTSYGLGPLPPVFINRDTTATLTVIANNTCKDVSSVRALMPPTVEDVPILTPAGMIALIGMLCIAGVGRIARKGRGS